MDFYGSHTHRIDAKGRLALPAVFRDAFAEEQVCFIVPEINQHCLSVYPAEAFRGMVDRLQQAKRDGKLTQKQLTNVMAAIAQSPIDSQGRINVPDRLRTWADLDKDATIVGVANHLAVFAAEVTSPDAALDELPDISNLL